MKKDAELTVITTHINADFDAMASMLAAQKLYPGAVVVFPGSQEKNLRNFFIQSMVYLFNMVDMKSINFRHIRRLVLVDTRQAKRIGRFVSLAKRKEVEVHIYDHHPDSTDDIPGHLTVVESTGATVTILTERIREKQIALNADEATILCLGIYEDTGSFTFPSTTQRDFLAAAYLLSKGADLNMVANLIAREITPEQVSLLNEMIQTSSRHNINGIEVVVTEVSTDRYVPDFALLVHKMVRMERIDAIFALARMAGKIYIVARSRISEVDVGAILAPMGGGGHAYAAAATIRDKTLVQIEQELLEKLYRDISVNRQARYLMSSPPIWVDKEVRCKEASERLLRYNINALLVMDLKSKERQVLLGFITRQVIEKAVYHKLDQIPVKEYMNTEFATVRADADLAEIQEMIIENKQRILPVVDRGQVIGVLTRTDLLNILVDQKRHTQEVAHDPLVDTIQARTRNVRKFMRERLSRELIQTLEDIGNVADELGYSAYVVGGFVRDLFLYRANEDVDIVIEGDGIAFSKQYARRVGARVHTHAKFGTAVIIFESGYKVDVASARLEYYSFPAALPTVEMGSIKLDLYRRDFTVNTLAIHLNHDRFGILIDFFNAFRDLKDKTIRVLHNMSFVEDPTRVFRAIRFEQRFGFTIGKLSAKLIENAVSMDFFKRLSGRRVFSELRQILEEENPTPALSRMAEFKLMPVIHPSIVVDQHLIDTFNGVRKVLAWYDLLFLEDSYKRWCVYFLALMRDCDRFTAQGICDRFELAPRHRKIFCGERFEGKRELNWLEHRVPVDNSILYDRLTRFRTELVLYMMAVTRNEKVKKAISSYFVQLRYVKPAITGEDLKTLGLTPGPIFREILQRVLMGKLDGHLHTPEDEIEFARTCASEAKALEKK